MASIFDSPSTSAAPQESASQQYLKQWESGGKPFQMYPPSGKSAPSGGGGGSSWGENIAAVLGAGTQAALTALTVKEQLKGDKKKIQPIIYQQQPRTDWKKVALYGGIAILVIGGGMYLMKRRK